MLPYLLATLVGLLVLTGVWVGLRRWSTSGRGRAVAAALAAWPHDLANMEQQFLAAAQATGKPRGLRWVAATPTGPVQFAFDRGEPCPVALVPVAIRFEAIPGGEMQDVEAVGNVRLGTAVFAWRGGTWQTSGRAILNLGPAATLERYADQLEPIGEPRVTA